MDGSKPVIERTSVCVDYALKWAPCKVIGRKNSVTGLDTKRGVLFNLRSSNMKIQFRNDWNEQSPVTKVLLVLGVIFAAIVLINKL